MDWVPFLREFGFPITVIAVMSWVLYRGIYVRGKDADARVAEVTKNYEGRIVEAEREKAYREERRLEERTNRLLTEDTLRNQVNVMRDMTELMKDIERNLRSQT
jgi:hypothetical protein